MIVYDDAAEPKLAKALETIREAPESERCIYFPLAAQPNFLARKGEVHKLIVDSATHFLADNSPQIFLCEDGDVFILAPNIQIKNAKFLMHDVANKLHTEVTDAFASFHEMRLHLNKLLMIVEEKLDKKRKEAESEQKQRDSKLAEQKRNAILNDQTLQHQSKTIAQRRSERKTADIMIIEDDAFSRRLVENVVQKQYTLTALGSAEAALSTYIRIAPDMLLLDINLPDVTGHELLEKIMQIDPDAYVVMLSGNSDRENIRQAVTLGAKGFIAKPFTRDKLFQYIERCPTIKH